MADEIENDGGNEVDDQPVAGILDAITDEPDPKLAGEDKVVETTAVATEVDSDGEVDTEVDAAEEQPGAAVKTPTLPAAHRRSLKAYGWEDAEIDQNLEALGPSFLATAARIHKNRNDEVTAWADAGRKARQTPQGTTQQQAVQQPVQQTGLQPIDTAALKKQYGEHELIDALAGPINQAIERMNKFAPMIEQSVQRSQQSEIEMLSKQIDGFFGGKELEPFKEVYGTPESVVADEKQQGNRNKVLEMAGNLIDGAKLQGRLLSLGDALTLAHDAVSSGFKTQVARNQIRGSLQARNKGITLKPSGKGKPASTGPAKNRSEIEKKVKAGLAQVFAGSN